MNMIQKEIEFFWPLTEQIPLDLDYTGCERKLTTIPITNVGTGQTLSLIGRDVKWTTTFEIDDNVVIKTKKLSWIGRLLYRMMGLKWQQKTS